MNYLKNILFFLLIPFVLNATEIKSNEIKNLNYKINNISKKIKTILKDKFIKINSNTINFKLNYSPFNINDLNNKDENLLINNKINNQNNNNNKEKKEIKYIIKLKPLIILNSKIFLKYIKINSLNEERTVKKLWVKPGDRFDLCKYLYSNKNYTKFIFKCQNKIQKVELLPKIKFKGEK